MINTIARLDGFTLISIAGGIVLFIVFLYYFLVNIVLRKKPEQNKAPDGDDHYVDFVPEAYQESMERKIVVKIPKSHVNCG